MADAIRIPRRKNGAKFHPKESPFPIPVQSITGKQSCNDRWYYYTGYFRDNCVVIEDLGDLTFLYKMTCNCKGACARKKGRGLCPCKAAIKNCSTRCKCLPSKCKNKGFFGKGFLSRSKPEYELISNISQKAFSKSEKLRRLPPREREIRQSKFRLIRKERFKNHQQWWQQAVGKEEGEKNDFTENEKCNEEIDDKSDEDLIVNEENASHTAKRRRKDVTEEDGDEPCVMDKELCNDSLENTEHSSDEQETSNVNNSEDDAETAITNRDLEKVIQDVVRNKGGTSSTCGSSQDIADEVTMETEQTKQKGSSTKQDDPYKVYEHLHLSLEEAFFLSYGLGCLSVLNESKQPMSLSEMWCTFREAKQEFIPNYVTYHYFRSKGWVPKMGIKYGTDLVLYKEGMPFYHSSYSVMVQLVDSEHLDTQEHDKTISCRQQISWPQLCGVSRVNGHAAKELMICYVIKPSDMTKDEMCSPKCISRFKIQEVVFRRWIPERAREPDKEKT